jgi:nitrogen fixation protein NifU and related proteins
MKKKTNLSEEFESNLDQWAIENLKGKGISKEKYSDSDFEKLKKIVKDQLREIYSDKSLDLMLMPVNNRKLDSPDGYAKYTGSCGDTMEFYLKVNDGLIADSSFQTDGCGPTVASGGMVAEMIKGIKIQKIKKIKAKDVLNALGGLPKENEHCAALALLTLNEALEDLKKRG